MELPTRLILLRHGETEWNACGKFQGHLDSPLTSKGLAQAEAMARRLEKVNFAALYCSDLGRAAHTAEIIARRTGHTLHKDPRLRERCLGIFQGLNKDEISRLHPQEFHLLTNGGPDYAVPEGESVAARFAINLQCLEEIAAQHPAQTTVVVSHGGLVSAMFRYVVGLPLTARRRFSLRNTSFNSFLREHEGWFLETWGDTAHS